MGYMKHNAIVVTNYDEKALKLAHEKAKEIFSGYNFSFGKGENLVSDVIYGIVNSQCSFFIAPDGSKEGWEDSNNGDDARKEFLDWFLQSENYSDYIEIRFGGGDDDNEWIVRSKDTDLHLDAENNNK